MRPASSPAARICVAPRNAAGRTSPKRVVSGAARRIHRACGPGPVGNHLDVISGCTGHTSGVNTAVDPLDERVSANFFGPAAGNAMKRTWTIIGVRNVTASFKWSQALFGQAETLPSHDHFGQILDT